VLSTTYMYLIIVPITIHIARNQEGKGGKTIIRNQKPEMLGITPTAQAMAAISERRT
jgi:hypothetical protein